MKNWKTTVAGIATAIAGISSIYSQNPPITTHDWIAFAIAVAPYLGVGSIGVLARDAWTGL